MVRQHRVAGQGRDLGCNRPARPLLGVSGGDPASRHTRRSCGTDPHLQAQESHPCQGWLGVELQNWAPIVHTDGPPNSVARRQGRHWPTTARDAQARATQVTCCCCCFQAGSTTRAQVQASKDRGQYPGHGWQPTTASGTWKEKCVLKALLSSAVGGRPIRQGYGLWAVNPSPVPLQV